MERKILAIGLPALSLAAPGIRAQTLIDCESIVDGRIWVERNNDYLSRDESSPKDPADGPSHVIRRNTLTKVQ